jgi:hypothetical protein
MNKEQVFIMNTPPAAWTAKLLPVSNLSTQQHTSAIIIIMPAFP